MPGLSFFADEQDAAVLLDWLNAEEDLAFIVQDKTHTDQSRRWKAVQTLAQLTEEAYSLWHVPGGSLPLLLPNSCCPTTILDPWAGWIEQQRGADERKPYFGAGHPSEIRLEIWTRHQPYTTTELKTLQRQVSWYVEESDLLPVSDFQWIGNRYSTSPQETWRWWRRLARWMDKNTIRVRQEYEGRNHRKRFGPSFWIFPSAFKKLSNGMNYYARGYDLNKAISLAAKSLS